MKNFFRTIFIVVFCIAMTTACEKGYYGENDNGKTVTPNGKAMTTATAAMTAATPEEMTARAATTMAAQTAEGRSLVVAQTQGTMVTAVMTMALITGAATMALATLTESASSLSDNSSITN